jgi:hypothetical protein
LEIEMPIRSTFAVIAALLAAAPSFAQFGLGPPKDSVRIEDVKVGLPATRFTNEREDSGASAPVVKAGTWAPVAFRLEVVRGTERRLHVEIESSDGDKNTTRVRWPLGSVVRNPQATGPDDQFLAKGSFIEPGEFEFMPAVKVGGPNSTLRLRIYAEGDGGEFLPASETALVERLPVRQPAVFTVLSLGTKLPGFQLSYAGKENPYSRALRGGRVETAAFAGVETMPDHWYAYEAADLVILATGNCSDDFLRKLFDDGESSRFKHKRDALLEWIRRGGKFVLGLSRKTDLLTANNAFKNFLPFAVPGLERMERTDVNSATGVGSLALTLAGKPRRKLDGEGKPLLDEDGKPVMEPADPLRFAKIQGLPGRPTRTLANLGSGADAPPAVLQTAVGLGRFTLVAFDPDTSPFLDLDAGKRVQFWDWLVKAAASEKSAEASKSMENTSYSPAFTETEEGVVAGLRNHIDHFEGVPVISFGWVALFIILYTILIGPLEYLFLKKVLGRLELTWITFPVIVVSVSVAAYFTAYSIKGKDLKINKVDVVDLDAAGGRVYGRTWYTVFSPRPASYNLAVEAKPNWATGPTDPADPVPETLVDWMAGAKYPEEGGISSKVYRYRLDPNGGTRQATGVPNGIENLTIGVWTTKTLTADWSGYAPKGIVESTVAKARDKDANPIVKGTFTLNLPLANVQDAVAYYAGQPYALGKDLRSGVPIPFDSSAKAANNQGSQWQQNEFVLDNRFYTNSSAESSEYSNPYPSQPVEANVTKSPINLWGLLFHEKLQGSGSKGTIQNAGLRLLDQSWRLDPTHKGEVIVLLRLAPAGGATEPMFADPDSPSPTQLWVKGIPGKEARPAVPGVIQQETFVRVYIPVK